jgi:hypothetical protein
VLASRADRGRSGEDEGEGHMTDKTTVTPFNVLDYLTTSAMIDAYVAQWRIDHENACAPLLGACGSSTRKRLASALRCKPENSCSF